MALAMDMRAKTNQINWNWNLIVINSPIKEYIKFTLIAIWQHVVFNLVSIRHLSVCVCVHRSFKCTFFHLLYILYTKSFLLPYVRLSTVTKYINIATINKMVWKLAGDSLRQVMITNCLMALWYYISDETHEHEHTSFRQFIEKWMILFLSVDFHNIAHFPMSSFESQSCFVWIRWVGSRISPR